MRTDSDHGTDTGWNPMRSGDDMLNVIVGAQIEVYAGVAP